MKRTGKAKVGVIGCGNISGIYLKNGASLFDSIEIHAVADLDRQRATDRAKEFGVDKVLTTEQILADPEIDLILNLTTPPAHFTVCEAALRSGKGVYVEKPLSITLAEGERLAALARERDLPLGGAPDTFLGAGIQTCLKLIEDGWIGRPVGATAFMLCGGHEGWHPDPAFYYRVGGGPMFDMGPYYLTALVNLMGPVQHVSGATRITFPTRTITSQPLHGTIVEVEVPTHVVGTLEFANGAVGTIITSFDVWAAELPRIEIYGTEGTLSVPDPNTFGGPVRVRRAGASEWSDIPLTHGYAENSRGIGVADMAYGLRSGRLHRANGELAYHVLDIMHAIHDAADAGRRVTLESTCERPAPLPLGLRKGLLDA